MTLDPRAAAWRTPRSDRESAAEDVAPYADATPAQRLADMAALCRMAARIIERLPADQRRRALMDQDPLPPRHEEALARLVARSRAAA